MNIPSHMRYAPSVALTITTATYRDSGRTAIRAIDCDTGEPVAMLSVNMPEISLAEDEVLIKDYSENEGALETLLRAGIVEALEVIPCGYAEVVKCKILREL
jgi:hypothetical protein